MIVALGLFFLDFVIANLFQHWLVSLLLVYFIGTLVLTNAYDDNKFLLIGIVSLFVLRDCAAHGFFGLCLLYIVPLLLFFSDIKALLHLSSFNLYLFLIVLTILVEAFVINNGILGQEQLVFVTIIKIFVNILFGIMVFLGMRGGRSFLALLKRERKVWTPNRIDAS